MKKTYIQPELITVILQSHQHLMIVSGEGLNVTLDPDATPGNIDDAAVKQVLGLPDWGAWE